ncbi:MULTISPECIES: ABC transporter permease [Halomonadaceae]|jgi:putative spermidine/putrescine transport system permease protein|uniref:Sulfate transport system permease protein CysW n=1 Tax=Vreelandella titanicae TaxID=664683 RepID=A0A653TMH8_9GAMM|nr:MULTISPECIES: ABC transporter permease [Halomonas]QKS23885.1 Sulfate transport system permease protein CysW [Halomonas titanicae]TMU17947.1 ABC transporter permease subunit [Halomonas sp. ATBC28]CAD5253818.1 ABC transporter permease [Halomonas sp. I3]CAD5255040.1 ABC transporter permease [Halomonas sp. 156]CAD5294022.1 ABC transporter permease [Halomonas sp. 113]
MTAASKQPSGAASYLSRPSTMVGPARRKRFIALFALLPALVIFCAFWLLPFSRLIMMGAEADPSSGISAYLTILTHRQYLISLATTVGLSLIVSLVAVAIAGVAGFFLARQRFFGKSILVAILTFPLAFPGVVVGFLVIMLGGRQGALAQTSLWLFGERWMFAYSLAGLFIGYLYFSIPRVITTVMAACDNLDRSLEEAARSLGANTWQVTKDVIVPGIAPALLSTGAICFATSMGAFGTAFTLGTQLSILPLNIYGEFTNYANFAMAAALSVVLGVITWMALSLARRLAGGNLGASV